MYELAGYTEEEPPSDTVELSALINDFLQGQRVRAPKDPRAQTCKRMLAACPADLRPMAESMLQRQNFQGVKRCRRGGTQLALGDATDAHELSTPPRPGRASCHVPQQGRRTDSEGPASASNATDTPYFVGGASLVPSKRLPIADSAVAADVQQEALSPYLSPAALQSCEDRHHLPAQPRPSTSAGFLTSDQAATVGRSNAARPSTQQGLPPSGTRGLQHARSELAEMEAAMLSKRANVLRLRQYEEAGCGGRGDARWQFGGRRCS